MSDKKELLVNLIVKHNVSAIVTISEKLEVDQETVVELIKELVAEKKLQGSITEDQARFFRSDAKVSEAPVIEREDLMPDFLNFDSRPGIILSIIGIIILAGGSLVSSYSSDAVEQNFAAGLFLIGILVLLSGLYLVAKRKYPE